MLQQPAREEVLDRFKNSTLVCPTVPSSAHVSIIPPCIAGHNIWPALMQALQYGV